MSSYQINSYPFYYFRPFRKNDWLRWTEWNEPGCVLRISTIWRDDNSVITIYCKVWKDATVIDHIHLLERDFSNLSFISEDEEALFTLMSLSEH